MTPTTANGYTLDTEVYRARGDNLELTLKPNNLGTVIRFLGYYNWGRMGDYQEALNIASAHATTPNVIADENPGRRKYGFGINLEQPLADGGETGLFARTGWSDGNTSAWSYTEVDRHLSAGLQVSGVHWWRIEDRFGIAYSIQGLSSVHQEYLREGGIGMLLGDGNLNYGPEQIFETYYRIQVGRHVQVTPDYQHIWNPGFNRDRGPVDVYSLRVRLYY
jgi:carbohydrate-selective porin OprB